MAPRQQLHELLLTLTEHVYFQPPSNIAMQFPCILYNRDASHSDHADNRPYLHAKRYQVTVVDRDPDSPLPDLVESLPLCGFDRSFVADGFNHWVFHLFF
jgi:hypothetical protein